MSDETTINTKGLDQLLKAMKKTKSHVRVGILGQSNARSSDGKGSTSNATIGAAHEYGTSSLPQRSFLRVPIAEHLPSRLDQSDLNSKDTFKQVMKSGTVVPWLTKVGILAEGIVLEAFDSGGFGKWKPSNMTDKANKQTLVESGQLRNAITSEVKE